eukprot:scaffold55267_cov35-Tisochrysis_lutea.AAC.3
MHALHEHAMVTRVTGSLSRYSASAGPCCVHRSGGGTRCGSCAFGSWGCPRASTSASWDVRGPFAYTGGARTAGARALAPYAVFTKVKRACYVAKYSPPDGSE